MKLARWIIAFVAVMGSGGFLADFVIEASARQHMLNPAWSPHAKFHDGQVILMGLGLGVLALVILFVPRRLAQERILLAAAVSGMYWVAALVAQLFPGTAWTDPEFSHTWSHPFGLDPQHFLSWILCGLLVVGTGLSLRDKDASTEV